MLPYKLLPTNWKDDLSNLLGEAKSDLLITSPFVSRDGTKFLLQNLKSSARSNIRLRFITNLSPQNVCQGATDPDALRSLVEEIRVSNMTHLPRLHAKVYIADTKYAIITSGNLTAGGLMRNHWSGVLTTDPATVSRVRADIEGLEHLGRTRQFCGIGGLLCRCAESSGCVPRADVVGAEARSAAIQP